MKCKPGDLAYITKAFEVTENIGRIVHVLRPHPHNAGLWIVNVVGMPAKTLRGNLRKIGSIADDCLTPIGNPNDGERATDRVVQPTAKTCP